MTFFAELEKNPKIHTELQKTPNSQSNLEKKGQSWSSLTLDILQSYSNQNCMVLAHMCTHTHTRRSMKQHKEPRIKPMHPWSINLQQKRQEYTMEKKISSISGAGRPGQLHVQG